MVSKMENENGNGNAIGSQIRDAVEESLRTGDFKQLKDVVSGTVDSAVSEVKKQIAVAAKNGNSRIVIVKEKKTEPVSRQEKGEKNQLRQAYVPPVRKKLKEEGKVSGTLYTVFGGIGTGIMCTVLLPFFLYRIIRGASLLTGGTFLIGALLLVFLLMIRTGCRNLNRVKRAKRYVSICAGKSYINIDELAMHLGRSEEKVRKDVRKMIQKGIFPEGHLDKDETCLMLDDATYREYLSVMRRRKEQQMQEQVRKMQRMQAGSGVPKEEIKEEETVFEQRLREGEKKKTADNPELEALIKEGQDCIRKLRNMNDHIKGDVISGKLFRLENLLKEIFERVEEHPEQMPQMRKFMSYYLPTTLKLVEAYEDFDGVSSPGEEILSAKTEIEKTLDTINEAFEKLLHKLYQSSVYDITTDAQVLQTMLASEGLTKEKELVRRE